MEGGQLYRCTRARKSFVFSLAIFETLNLSLKNCVCFLETHRKKEQKSRKMPEYRMICFFFISVPNILNSVSDFTFCACISPLNQDILMWIVILHGIIPANLWHLYAAPTALEMCGGSCTRGSVIPSRDFLTPGYKCLVPTESGLSNCVMLNSQDFIGFFSLRK